MVTSIATGASTSQLAGRAMVASTDIRVLTSRVIKVAKLMPVQSTILATWPRQLENYSPAPSLTRWTKGCSGRWPLSGGCSNTFSEGIMSLVVTSQERIVYTAILVLKRMNLLRIFTVGG